MQRWLPISILALVVLAAAFDPQLCLADTAVVQLLSSDDADFLSAYDVTEGARNSLVEKTICVINGSDVPNLLASMNDTRCADTECTASTIRDQGVDMLVRISIGRGREKPKKVVVELVDADGRFFYSTVKIEDGLVREAARTAVRRALRKRWSAKDGIPLTAHDAP